MVYETNSQIIKQILELCEAFGMPTEVKNIVKNKCWKLTKNEYIGENENENRKNNSVF